MAADRQGKHAWNTVAVARRGETGRAVEALSAVGRFWPTRYRQVIAGYVEPPPAARRIAAEYERHCEWPQLLERLLPLERSAPFERADVTETLCLELENEYQRLCGRTFYVRARLRGLEGRLEGRAVERAVGGFLVERTQAAGAPAQVRFDDPDLVLMIEVIEQRVGFGLLDREVRRLPLVRPR